jgi:LuxR family transcriptional regulator
MNYSLMRRNYGTARDHGLRKGITQCLMLPNHALGFLSVSRTSVMEIPFAMKK